MVFALLISQPHLMDLSVRSVLFWGNMTRRRRWDTFQSAKTSLGVEWWRRKLQRLAVGCRYDVALATLLHPCIGGTVLEFKCLEIAFRSMRIG